MDFTQVGLDREVDTARREKMWVDLASLFPRLSRGLCFRIDVDDVLGGAHEDIWQQVAERTAQLGLKPSDVDVLMDLRSLHDRDERLLKESVIDFTLEAGRFKPRTFVLSGSSALHTVSDVPADGELAVRRAELWLWAEIFTDTNLGPRIVFSDYGVVYPDFDRDTSATHINAKIRYTAQDKIHYFRGQLYSKIAPLFQYPELARRVVGSGIYAGRDYSFGDRYIHDCAAGWERPKAPGPWVFADQNRHFVYTANQAARLSQILGGMDEIERVLTAQS